MLPVAERVGEFYAKMAKPARQTLSQDRLAGFSSCIWSRNLATLEKTIRNPLEKVVRKLHAHPLTRNVELTTNNRPKRRYLI
jgi:hypothetical protein